MPGSTREAPVPAATLPAAVPAAPAPASQRRLILLLGITAALAVAALVFVLLTR
jgi:hypothetical protein